MGTKIEIYYAPGYQPIERHPYFAARTKRGTHYKRRMKELALLRKRGMREYYTEKITYKATKAT